MYINSTIGQSTYELRIVFDEVIMMKQVYIVKSTKVTNYMFIMSRSSVNFKLNN